jgi:uncharacterized protein YutE (UPF0331/DUF86 family)
MASIKEKIYAEIENITRVLTELKKVKDKPGKDLIILVGIGAYLQNIYSGMENILKQIISHKNLAIPNKPSWHKDLLLLAVKHNVITEQTADKLGKYLVFRHFFTHSYGFHIDEKKLTPLMNKIPEIYSEFKKDIDDYLQTIEEKEKMKDRYD